MPQATLGAAIKVQTLEGEAELEIPAGAQSGTVFRLKGKGVPHLRSRQRGDQLITLVVETPHSLTEEQRRLVQELARTMGEQQAGPDRRDKGLFGKIKDALGTDE
jgi:molecular chaperone DnaJ